MRKALLLAGAALIGATPAHAQEVPPTVRAPGTAATSDNSTQPNSPLNGDSSATSVGSSGLADIIVTAQKRAQNLQSVPVSVTALTADQIRDQRINEFGDLSRAAASLTIVQTGLATSSSPVLRGIGTNVFSIGVEPSVSVIVDDVAVIQQGQAFESLNDIARIEVLKGPQGLLFGKNASAGAINIVTADPTTALSGLLQVSGSTNADYRVDGSISGQITTSVTARASGYYNAYNGNVLNLYDGHKLNDRESYGGRLKVKFQLAPDLTYTLVGSYAKVTQDGTGTTFRYISGTPAVLGVPTLPLLPTLSGISPGSDNYRTNFDADSPTRSEQFTFSGRGVLGLGAVDLLSITAYQDWRYNLSQDVDQTALNVLGPLTRGALSGGIFQYGLQHTRNFTQELRAVSVGSGPLKYVGGAYFSDASTTYSFTRGPGVLVSQFNGEAKTRDLAAFGQVDYTLPTRTTISGGLRVSNERIAASFDNLVSTATAATCVTGTAACRGNNTDSAVTYKVSVSQPLAQKVFAYGSIASGYKGYAYDVSTGFTPARVNGTVGPIPPERSTAYEIGLKSRTADNRLQLNLAAFLTNYTNFQAQGGVLVNNLVQLQLESVGRLRTKGVEAEFSAQATPRLRLDASAAYVDAIITSFPNAQSYFGQVGQVYANGASAIVGPCTTAIAATAASPSTLCTYQDRSGARLPNSPRFKFNVGASGDVPLGNDVAGTFTINYLHQSSVNFDLYGDPLDTQNAYGVLNGSIGVRKGGITLTAFANNLFNNHYASYLADSFALFGGSASNPAHVISQFHTEESQRYFGLRAAAKF